MAAAAAATKNNEQKIRRPDDGVRVDAGFRFGFISTGFPSIHRNPLKSVNTFLLLSRERTVLITSNSPKKAVHEHRKCARYHRLLTRGVFCALTMANYYSIAVVPG